MNQSRAKDDHHRIKPGAILRAAGAGGKPRMPNFAEEAMTAAPPPTPTPAHDAGQARLAVERNGDHVAKIIAYCKCGEKIVIDCDYAASGDAAAAGA